jgi:hypothetical protein
MEDTEWLGNLSTRKIAALRGKQGDGGHRGGNFSALFSVKYKKNKALQGQDDRWKCGRITIILTLP